MALPPNADGDSLYSFVLAADTANPDSPQTLPALSQTVSQPTTRIDRHREARVGLIQSGRFRPCFGGIPSNGQGTVLLLTPLLERMPP